MKSQELLDLASLEWCPMHLLGYFGAVAGFGQTLPQHCFNLFFYVRFDFSFFHRQGFDSYVILMTRLSIWGYVYRLFNVAGASTAVATRALVLWVGLLWQYVHVHVYGILKA